MSGEPKPARSAPNADSEAARNSLWSKCFENMLIKAGVGAFAGYFGSFVLFRGPYLRAAVTGMSAGVGLGIGYMECRSHFARYHLSQAHSSTYGGPAPLWSVDRFRQSLKHEVSGLKQTGMVIVPRLGPAKPTGTPDGHKHKEKEKKTPSETEKSSALPPPPAPHAPAPVSPPPASAPPSAPPTASTPTDTSKPNA